MAGNSDVAASAVASVLQEFGAAVAGAPDPRPEKVATTRRRIAGGYYHAVVVRATVAGAVDRVLQVLDQV